MKRLAVLALSFTALFALSAEEVKFTVSELGFTAPDGWKKVEPKFPSRKAQFEISGKEGGKPAELTFSFFGGGQGGGVEENVKRWYGLFDGPADVRKSEAQEFNGVKMTVVTTEGTLKPSMISGTTEPQPDFALLGAIVEHGEGFIFVKLTGPKDLVKASREKFVAMLKSVTPAK